MSQFKLKINNEYYMTSNNWKSFKRITEEKANKISNSVTDVNYGKRAFKIKKDLYVLSSDFYQNVSILNDNQVEDYIQDSAGSIEYRYMEYQGLRLRTKNFWFNYEIYSQEIPSNAIVDSINKVLFRKRYLKIKSKCLVTKDFWKTFFYNDDIRYCYEDKNSVFGNRKCKVGGSDYYTNEFYESIHECSNENDYSNYVYDEGGTYPQKRAKIQVLYPREKAYILFKELDRIHFAYNDVKESGENTGYGKEFEIFALHRYLDIPESEAEKHILGGSGDGGVDAVALKDDYLCAYQMKFHADADLNKMFKMQQNISRLVMDDYRNGELKDASKLIDYRNKHISEFLDKNYKIVLIGEEIPSATKYNNQFIAYVDGNPEKKVSYYFKNCDEIINDFIDDFLVVNTFLNKLEITSPNMKAKIFPDSSRKEVFCYMNAKDLCKALYKLCINPLSLDKLFMNNVRGYFGKNTSIEYTVLNKPENFLMCNNGVSICCSNRIDCDTCTTKLTLSNPSIVNGQQTVRTLLEIYKTNPDQLINVTVPLFIKTCDDIKDRLEIAVANNKQQKVSEVDLLSADYFTKKLPDVLYRASQSKNPEDASKWIMVKINSSGSKEIDSYYSCIFEDTNIIELKDYFRTLFPIIYHINNNERLYLNIFSKNSSKMIDTYVNPNLEDSTVQNDVKEARLKYEELIDNESEVLYSVCASCVKAKLICKSDKTYLPTAHIIGILLYLNISENDIINYLAGLSSGEESFVEMETKKKIAYVASTDFENGLKAFIKEKTENSLESD